MTGPLVKNPQPQRRIQDQVPRYPRAERSPGRLIRRVVVVDVEPAPGRAQRQRGEQSERPVVAGLAHLAHVEPQGTEDQGRGQIPPDGRRSVAPRR